MKEEEILEILHFSFIVFLILSKLKFQTVKNNIYFKLIFIRRGKFNLTIDIYSEFKLIYMNF